MGYLAKYLRYVVGAVIIFIAPFISVSVGALELRTAAQDSPPKYFIEDDHDLMQGLCIDILEALQKTAPALRFTGQNEFMHSGRIYSALSAGSLDLFCGSATTPEREKRFYFLPTPLYPVNNVLASRSDDRIDISDFDRLRDQQPPATVMTYLNSASHRYLARQDGIQIEAGSDLPNLFERLVRGRGRYIFYHDLGLKHFIASNKMSAAVRIQPASFRQYHHFIVISRKVPLELRDRLERLLEQLKNSGELERIYRRWSTDSN